jgi:hypothetical protein
VGSLKNVNPKKDLRPSFFGSFFGRAKNKRIIFGRTKNKQDNLWACRKTVAPKSSAALIFLGYFFVSRQKSNCGLGQHPEILKAEVVLFCALFLLY